MGSRRQPPQARPGLIARPWRTLRRSNHLYSPPGTTTGAVLGPNCGITPEIPPAGQVVGMLLSETAMASRRLHFGRSAQGVLGGLLTLVVSAAACSSANPTSPSPVASSLVAAHGPAPANNVMLTVRVLARASE